MRTRRRRPRRHSKQEEVSSASVGSFSNEKATAKTSSAGPRGLMAAGPVFSLGGTVQAKLTVNQPGDRYEREADAVAERVTSGQSVPAISALSAGSLGSTTQRQEEEEPVPEQAREEEETAQMQVQRQGGEDASLEESEETVAASEGPVEEEEEQTAQAKAQGGNSGGATIASSLQGLQGGGRPLPTASKAYFEPRFGRDFSQVRVHTGSQAAKSAQTLNARAYTSGRNIAFGAGEYAPGTPSGKKLLAHELTHVVQQSSSQVQQKSGNEPVVQRQRRIPLPAGESFVIPLPPDVVDDIVRRSVLRELRRFQRIPVVVQGVVAGDTGSQTVPVRVRFRVRVRAAYFINTPTGRVHYQTPRQQADFEAIKRALSTQTSLVRSSTGGRLSAGRAVEIGKGTPEDLRRVIQEAVRQGAIRQFAIGQGTMTEDQQLVELGPARVRNLIQQWVRHVGVGVDCSGFVLQAAYRARENVRATAAAANRLLEARGVSGRIEVPPQLGRQVRSAASFRSGPRVAAPTTIRPGDAWVVSGGGHIRIVTAVRERTLPDGSRVIEFRTAESSGGSTQPDPGPVARRWRTHSLTVFDPITRVGGGGGNVTGSFHRIQ